MGWLSGSSERRRWRETSGGEKPLAGATAEDGTLAIGTRDALHLAPVGKEPHRIPWEQVQSAHWDPETDTFRVSEVGTWGEPRPEHTLQLDEARQLLELVRDRVTSSIVMQVDVQVPGHGGVRVIARRAPSSGTPLRWLVEYDEGVDPAAEEVRAAASAALARAREEVGQG